MAIPDVDHSQEQKTCYLHKFGTPGAFLGASERLTQGKVYLSLLTQQIPLHMNGDGLVSLFLVQTSEAKSQPDKNNDYIVSDAPLGIGHYFSTPSRHHNWNEKLSHVGHFP